MRINTLYGTKEIVTDQGYQTELRYYLVQEILPGNWPEEEKALYGISILSREGERWEQEELLGLSQSMMAVETLLRRMMHGVVTPVTAASVVDDWVAERAG